MTHIFADEVMTIQALADFVVLTARNAISATGRFTVALSGGSSPRRLHDVLATKGNDVDWSRVFFFFGDERFVPHDHPDSNYKMAADSLLTPLHISPAHVFPVDTSLTPEAAARAYEADIIRHFRGEVPAFDLILLGLGDDAHTASLFPHTAVLDAQKALVKEVFVPKLNAHRITFTPALINGAREVAFLVYGDAKTTAVKHVLEGNADPHAFPAQLVRPANGVVHWFLDRQAAAALANHGA